MTFISFCVTLKQADTCKKLFTSTSTQYLLDLLSTSHGGAKKTKNNLIKTYYSKSNTLFYCNTDAATAMNSEIVRKK